LKLFKRRACPPLYLRHNPDSWKSRRTPFQGVAFLIVVDDSSQTFCSLQGLRRYYSFLVSRLPLMVRLPGVTTTSSPVLFPGFHCELAYFSTPSPERGLSSVKPRYISPSGDGIPLYITPSFYFLKGTGRLPSLFPPCAPCSSQTMIDSIRPPFSRYPLPPKASFFGPRDRGVPSLMKTCRSGSSVSPPSISENLDTKMSRTFSFPIIKRGILSPLPTSPSSTDLCTFLQRVQHVLPLFSMFPLSSLFP